MAETQVHLSQSAVGAEGYAGDKILFDSNSQVVYSVGNCLKFCPLEHEQGADSYVWGEGSSIGCIASEPSRGLLVYSERYRTLKDPRVYVFDVAAKMVSVTLTCDGELSILDVAISKEGPLLAVLGGVPEHNVMVWDFAQRQLLAKVSARASRALSISFNPLNSHTIATTGSKLELWELQLAEGQEPQLMADPHVSLEQEDREFTAHVWAPGNVVVVGSDTGEILPVNARTGKKVAGSGWLSVCNGAVGAMAITKRHIVVGTSEGKVVWATMNGSAIEYRTPWVEAPITALTFAPNFECMIVGTIRGDVYLVRTPEPMLLASPDWNPEAELTPEHFGGFPDGHIQGLDVFGKLPMACTVGSHGTITVWKMPTLEAIATKELFHEHCCSCVAVSEECRAVAVGSDFGVVSLVDLSDFSDPRDVFHEKLHHGWVINVKFAMPYLISASSDSTIALCLLENEQVRPAGRFNVPGLIDFQVFKDRIIVATSDKKVHSFKLPDKDSFGASPTADQLNLETESVSVPASLSKFTVVDTGHEDSAKILAWCRDYGLRTFDFVASPFSMSVVSAYLDSSSPGTALAVASNAETALCGTGDGVVAIRNITDLEAAPALHQRHLGKEGGVSAVALGSGNLKGWMFSCGADGAIFSQPYQAGVTVSRELQPPAVHGMFADLELADPASAEQSEHTAFESTSAAVGAAPGAQAVSAAATEINEELQALKEQFAEILAHNKEVQDLEKLDRSELVIDIAERDRMVQKGDAQVAEVREEILRANLRKDLQSDRIRESCYDSIEAKQLVVVPLGGKAVTVSSFALPKLTTAEQSTLQRVKVLRRMEIREMKAKADEGIRSATDGVVMSMAEFKAAQGDQQSGEKVEEDVDDEAEGTEDDLLYKHMQLTMRERKINQVHLLREKVRLKKIDFNNRVAECIKQKSGEIDKIDEKNARLQEIFDELKVQEILDKFGLAATEEEGSELKVEDHEIKVEKYLSAEERLAQEKARAEEEARKAASAKDDQIARALQEMMYGTLESKKQDAGEEEIEKPAFIDEPPETLSDEQVKIIREYEKKLKAFQEEQEKQRKALETEAKKVRGDIQAIVEAFDQKLVALADEKHVVDAQIYELELQITLLLDSVVKEEDAHFHIQKLLKQVDIAEADCQAATIALNQFKEELDAFRFEYETVLGKDRQAEKDMRKEFADSPHSEELHKLFKRRRYPSLDKSADPANVVVNLDPFAITEENEEELPRPEPLGHEDFPEDCDQETRERLQELRENKIDLELEVKRKATQLVHMNQRLAELAAIQNDAQGQYDFAREELKRLQDEQRIDQYDLVMLLTVKQGQVEMEMENMLDDVNDGAMLEVSLIRKLNEVVKGLGKEKVGMMAELMQFRKKIHSINWENEMLEFKSDEVQENTRYFQLLWVTKELQTIIKGGDDDRKAAENQTLEKQIEHCKQLHELKVEDMKRRLFKAHKQIREKELENNKLSEYVQDLNVSVAQREKIMRVRESDKDAVDEKEYRMQEVVWRRLVLEEARQQSEDIAILKAEVDRLRQRTFPSFAKNYTAQHALGK